MSTITLGDLYETCSRIDRRIPLNGGMPRCHSWRGDYYQLTLEQDNSVLATVVDLTRVLHLAHGAIFEGYKGGDYEMGSNTPIWNDPYGVYLRRAILGIKITGGQLRLVTKYSNEEDLDAH